jgi:hypothetical protein
MTDHPNPDTLADHAEGLLPEGQAADVAHHLQGCTDCRATQEALVEVTTLLTAYADPGPMPAVVADRLDAALRSAAAEEAAPAGPAEPAAAATVVPLGGRRPGAPRTPWSSKVLQVAAVLVLLAAVTAVGVAALGGGNTGSTSAGGAAKDASGRDSSTEGTAGGAAAGKTLVTKSGTAYTQANLGRAARSLVAASSQRGPVTATPNPATQDFGSSLPADQRRLTDQAPALASCVRQLTGRDVTPLSVDIGTWQGTPATVIVVPTQDDPRTVDVYAVRPACPPGLFLSYVHLAR